MGKFSTSASLLVLTAALLALAFAGWKTAHKTNHVRVLIDLVFFIFFVKLGAYIGVVTVLLPRLGGISLLLLVAMFKPWGFMDPKICVSDIVLQTCKIIIPLVFLTLAYKIERIISSRGQKIPDLCRHKQSNRFTSGITHSRLTSRSKYNSVFCLVSFVHSA